MREDGLPAKLCTLWRTLCLARFFGGLDLIIPFAQTRLLTAAQSRAGNGAYKHAFASTAGRASSGTQIILEGCVVGGREKGGVGNFDSCRVNAEHSDGLLVQDSETTRSSTIATRLQPACYTLTQQYCCVKAKCTGGVSGRRPHFPGFMETQIRSSHVDKAILLRQRAIVGWRQWTEPLFSRFCGGTNPKFPL